MGEAGENPSPFQLREPRHSLELLGGKNSVYISKSKGRRDPQHTQGHDWLQQQPIQFSKNTVLGSWGLERWLSG